MHLQAVQIEEEVQKLVQYDTESLMVYCERGRELMRKMDVLRFADKDRRMVSALVRGLRHDLCGSLASKIAERPNRLRIKGFLRNGAAGTLTSGGGPGSCPYPSRLSSGWDRLSPPAPDPIPSSRLPVNKCLYFEIPLWLGSFFNVAGTVGIQSRHGSR